MKCDARFELTTFTRFTKLTTIFCQSGPILVLVRLDSFFTVVRDYRTRGHSLKLFVPDARVNCRKHFFAVRVINVWNSLPDEVVSTNQLSWFKTHIKQINLNNFLIGKA